MAKIHILKFVISIYILFIAVSPSMSKEKTFVSLSPALTEIIYALDLP